MTKRPSPKPSIGLRLKPETIVHLDELAKRSDVTRAAMAELLIVAGLEAQGFDVEEVRADVREARGLAVTYSKRIALAIGREVDEILAETT